MRRGRIITAAFTILASVLLAASASAATPGEIAQDLRDGQLDGSYSQADLQGYLQSAMAQGYGNPVVTPVTPAPTSQVAGVATPSQPAGAPTSGVAGAQKTSEQPLAATGRVGTLPFTGVDLALLTIGGAVLLLLGVGARRAGRARN